MEPLNLLFNASVVFINFFELYLKRIWLLDICRYLLSIRGEDAFNVSVSFGVQTFQQKGLLWLLALFLIFDILRLCFRKIA